MYRQLYRYGFIVYAIMLAMAVVFYKERTILLDTAYHLFYILKDGAFTIQNNRYGAIVTQIVPLLCSKIGVSLKTTMILYSCSFVLWPLFCYWVCGYWLRQYAIALVLLLYNILLVTDTFYWAISELTQGIAYSCMVIALLLNVKKNTKILPALSLALLSMGTAFFHPVLLMPLAFMFLFIGIHKELIHNKAVFYFTASIALASLVAKQVFFSTAYESNSIHASSAILTGFTSWFTLESFQSFIRNCAGNFIWIPVCTVLVMGTFIIRRRWLSLALFVSALLGYLLLIQATYPTSATVPLYIENLYLPVAIIIGLPLVFYVFPELYKKKGFIPMALLVAISLSFFGRVYINRNTYKGRIDWERGYMALNPGKKLMVAETPELRSILILSWGSPYEFWLLSTMEKGRTENIIISDRIDEITYSKDDTKSLATSWGAFPYATLPSNYFICNDTLSRFEVRK